MPRGGGGSDGPLRQDTPSSWLELQHQPQPLIDLLQQPTREPSYVFAKAGARERSYLCHVGDRSASQAGVRFREPQVAGNLAPREVGGKGHRQDPLRSAAIEEIGLYDHDRTPLVGYRPPDLAATRLWPIYHSSSPNSCAQASAT